MSFFPVRHLEHRTEPSPLPQPRARKRQGSGPQKGAVQVFSVRLTPPKRTDWTADERTEYDGQVAGFFKAAREVVPKFMWSAARQLCFQWKP